MTTKSPDICCVSRCRKASEYILEGKPYCEEHFIEASDAKEVRFKQDHASQKFKEKVARERLHWSAFEEGLYSSPKAVKEAIREAE
jgi:hypothetical protein